MNKAYNRCLLTRLPLKKAPVYLGVEWIVCYSPCSRANKIYSSSSDKLTEVQLYMSTSCQKGSRVNRAFSDVQKLFFYFLI